MNITSLLALLSAAASMLTLAQGHSATTAFMQEAINFGSNTVQVVTQASAPIGFSVPKDSSIWPTAVDLANAPYIDTPGHWAPLGQTVTFLSDDISFGDLNNDKLDDAAVIVNRPSAGGVQNYFLAAMLNSGGIMFNIADFPLGTSIAVASHSISGENILLNGQSYKLLGNTIIKN